MSRSANASSDSGFKISAIIPTYNRKQVLHRALSSVKNQTLPPMEIIVLDDGSTDDTAQMLASRFPEVRYHYQDNDGVSQARNKAIELAQGDWLAFLDSDDQWLPQKLAQQVTALQKEPGYRLCHTEELWVRNGKRVNPMNKHRKYGGHIYEQCLPLCCISPSSVLLHRSLLAEVGLFDPQLPACEDYDLWLRICAHHPVLFVDEALLVKYGGHDVQLSRKHWGMDRFRVRALDAMLKKGELNIEQQQKTRDMLNRKCRILIKGATKHDNEALLQECRGILSRHHLLESSSAGVES